MLAQAVSCEQHLPQSKFAPIPNAAEEDSQPTGRSCQPSCLRCRFLCRFGGLALSLLLLTCGAVGLTYILHGVQQQLRHQAEVEPTTSSATSHPPSLLADDYPMFADDLGQQRWYMASNLSLLLAGGWPRNARFYPVSFHSAISVLNNTVFCDRPSPRDAGLVYSQPTWVCKNIR